ncbi:toprim domain-containing protein [Streptomyces sp. NPDC090442]|uniref:toprim domain-containing protein n=1 Tax=Streptomyces sp. NPDC090442 TaxID=3365962 RepID=UPI003830F0C0
MKFAEVLARFADVREEPDGYVGVCPAHRDRHPSLRITRDDTHRVLLKCRAGCDTGDVITAARLSWSDLFDVAGPGATVSSKRPEMVGPGPTAALAMYVDETSCRLLDFRDQAAEDARSYVTGRFGLDLETAADLMLGVDDGESAPNFPYRSDVFTRYRRLTVPLHDFQGVARGLQGRDLTGRCPGRWISLRNPEGQRWAPYGVLRGRGGHGVTLVTEGPGDGLTAVAAGYDAVLIRGASIAGNPALLEELAAGLRGRQVIAAGDNDAAGHTFNRRLSKGLAAHGLPVLALALPNPGDDLTDWRAADPAAFPGALHQAVRSAWPC